MGALQAVTVARLLLEIRRRAASAPHDVPRGAAIKAAALQVLAEPAATGPDRPRKLLADLLGTGKGQSFDVTAYDRLTPEAILRLDAIARRLGG